MTDLVGNLKLGFLMTLLASVCDKSSISLGGCDGSVVERRTPEREVQESNRRVVSLRKTL